MQTKMCLKIQYESDPGLLYLEADKYSTGEPHMSILDGWTYLRLIYVLRSGYCHDNPGI